MRKLGKSDLNVSILGVGTFNTVRNAEQMRVVVERALDCGINFFDTAESYGNGKIEDALGQALINRRHSVVLATKWGGGGQVAGLRTGARDYIVPALEKSLARLRTDYIDLYQYHHLDRSTPIAETMEVLRDLIGQGKVRYVGLSNMPSAVVASAVRAMAVDREAKLVTCQDRYNLLFRKPEEKLVPAMKELGLSLIPYFPLEGGLLTGKYSRATPPPAGSRFAKAPDSPSVQSRMSSENFDKIELLSNWAARRGHSLLELSLSWLAAEPAVGSIIAGVRTPEQVEQNAAAVRWQLNPEELSEVNSLSA